MTEIYETEILNDSGRPYTLHEQNRVLAVIQPLSRRVIESGEPTTLYAPYSRLLVRADGSVELTRRESFALPEPPEGAVRVAFCNIEGGELEYLPVEPIGTLRLPRGIPVPVLLPSEHPLAKYSEINLVKRKHFVELRELPNYAVEKSFLEQERVERR
jgi:hypothetical protein